MQKTFTMKRRRRPVRAEIAQALEAQKQETLKLQMELDSVKSQLTGLKQFEDTIKGAAIDARRNADTLMQNARKEAELILSRAKEEAERALKDRQGEMELAEAAAQLMQAAAQLQTIKRLRKKLGR